MSDVRIITNGHSRDLVSYNQLPESVRQSGDFDYILTSDLTSEDDLYSPRFVQYRGSWYDTGDTDGVAPFPGWDTYASDSFFSGVVFRFVPEDGYETVVVGLYLA